MLSSELIAILNKLPQALQAKVLNYAEYLATKSAHPQSSDPTPKKYRQAGTMKGMFAMADDFDAPLEDLKSYMKPCPTCSSVPTSSPPTTATTKK